MPEEEIGKVSTFFARPVVAGIDLTSSLNIGDTIHIVGHTTDIELKVDSIQIDNVDVKQAKAGDSVGIKVTDRVRPGDRIYKVA
ncbi:MAG: translation elongation factor-like protein [Dehalococcoidia bacterium]|jgi:selenocysteine-specific translation elongation factor|nr:translation elongation factor-like protein [Dehalococcoidia bacterium]